MRFRTRLLVVLGPTILVSFSAMALVADRRAENALLDLMHIHAALEATARAEQLDALFVSSSEFVEGLASSIGLAPVLDRRGIQASLISSLDKHANIYGSTLAFVAGATELQAFAPYVFRTQQGIVAKDLTDPAYDYSKWDWFRRPLESGRGAWSEPYFDRSGGNVFMTTYSTPIFRHGRPVGVATADIALEQLTKRAAEILVTKSSYAIILSQEGRFLAHPNEALLHGDTIGELAAASGNPARQRFAKLLADRPATPVEVYDPFGDRVSWLVTVPIESTGWTLALLYPRDEVMAPLSQLRHHIFLVALLGIVLIYTVLYAISHSITRPLKRLAGFARGYTDNAGAIRLDDIQGPDETRDLVRAFRKMLSDIAAQIDIVRATTVQKERYRQELVIASEIQKSILPSSAEPFPEFSDRLQVFGLTEPAREVGGDYYDYFRLPNGNIAVVVGDVSDKGAASAIFMAMTRVLVREVAEQRCPPTEVLRRVNHILCRDNESSMFVTLLYVEYDPATGIVRLASAGHPPPIHIDLAEAITPVVVSPNLPIGAISGTRYGESRFRLRAGETLVLYTDGVTEAHDTHDELYGDEGLAACLATLTRVDSEHICRGILSSVRSFAGKRDASDDITILVLQRCFGAHTIAMTEQEITAKHEFRLSLPVDPGALEMIDQAVASVGRRAGLEGDDLTNTVAAVREVATNVLKHAYQTVESESFVVDLETTVDALTVVVTDHGCPFDFNGALQGSKPKEAPSPVGDSGLNRARSLVNAIRYEPGTIEGNRVTLTKRLRRRS